ncbi:hypothetical protein [Pseudoroseicyclus tamaricis]|uniref:Uncharacterized protein n=1 Tax=Pseudoroseicyclus tamaricis TaxID=2705421 RepID=A0A6B2JJL6_9RHOB|nr:hypothetical protein [Pseudoroseicyclus tamaricis]NDV01641.1 hypothetical protein [Pseudoroseicyclus tamaricis]
MPHPAPTPRGAAPVGQLAELGALESGAVLALRLWCEGAREEIGLAGPGLEALTGAMRLLLDHGRRRLMRHGTTCSCLGGDEACFAQLVALAATGEEEEALMLAMLMVRGDMAPALIHHAGDLGRALALSCAQLERLEQMDRPPASHAIH